MGKKAEEMSWEDIKAVLAEKARECGIGIVKQVGNSIEMDAGKLRAY